MERKYGFNMLWMYAGNRGRTPQEANETELDFIAEEGFNFIRIPTDYHFWTDGFDYFHPDEKIIAYFDRYIAACNSRGLHVCLNLHRAPGYCINWPEREKHNLWRDPEAQEGFIFLWKMFAERYKGIPSEKLSFDLVNEPCSIGETHPCTRDDHEKVIITCAVGHKMRKPATIEEERFAISQIASDTHVRMSTESRPKIMEPVEERIVTHETIDMTFLAEISSKTQDYIFACSLHHSTDPMVRLRNTIGIGEQ